MTDRELMQMALDAFELNNTMNNIFVARLLRERLGQPEPVHAIDMTKERVDETAKREHEWVGLDGDIPGLGLVTEEFYNGMLCAEDILRKRNT